MVGLEEFGELLEGGAGEVVVHRARKIADPLLRAIQLPGPRRHRFIAFVARRAALIAGDLRGPRLVVVRAVAAIPTGWGRARVASEVRARGHFCFAMVFAVRV